MNFKPQRFLNQISSFDSECAYFARKSDKFLTHYACLLHEIGAAVTNWLALVDFTHNTFGVENKHMTSTFEEMAGKFFGIWFGHSLANEVEQIVGFHIPQLKEFKSMEYKFGESLGIQVKIGGHMV